MPRVMPTLMDTLNYEILLNETLFFILQRLHIFSEPLASILYEAKTGQSGPDKSNS
jgi:hypothetical protein